MIRIASVLSLALFILKPAVYGVHPLSTADAPTMGKGSLEVEISGIASAAMNGDFITAVTTGVFHSLDISVSLPCDIYRLDNCGEPVTAADHRSLHQYLQQSMGHGAGSLDFTVKWQLPLRLPLEFAALLTGTWERAEQGRNTAWSPGALMAIMACTVDLGNGVLHFNWSVYRSRISIAGEYPLMQDAVATIDMGVDEDARFIIAGMRWFAPNGIIISGGYRHNWTAEGALGEILVALTVRRI